MIRIITGSRSEYSSGDLFKNLKILHFPSQYMLSFFLYVIKNKNKFKLNSDVYNVSTRQKHNFHQPSSYLSLYMKKESTQLA